MIYLFNTHLLLWSQFKPERLSKNVKSILENDADEKVVSAINLWEISIKYSLGKLELPSTNPDQLLEKFKEAGFRTESTTPEMMASYYRLPKKENHKDPFDRMLIWQAMESNATLVSHDSKMSQYISDGLKLVTNI